MVESSNSKEDDEDIVKEDTDDDIDKENSGDAYEAGYGKKKKQMTKKTLINMKMNQPLIRDTTLLREWILLQG